MTNASGYITDTPYIPGFYPNMAPLAMRYVSALNKIEPPSGGESFRYLELGCGLGRTLTTLAAANPKAEFVGVDVNPNHTAFVEEDIAAGELDNARVLTADFSSLPDDLGLFDFIAVHGVISWVSPQVRDQVVDISRKHLAPGGLFLVSYNAMPGWAHLQPIRGILRQYAQLRQGDASLKVREAMAYLVLLRDKQAKYFVDNPGAAAYVDGLLKQDIQYLAHEFLHEYWSPFYFSEVSELLAPAELGYVGGLPVFTNFWDLCIKPEFHDLFRTSTSRLVVEAHKDFCTNTAFRWDIYGKGCRILPTISERVLRVDDVYYRNTRPDLTLPYQVNLGQVTSTVKGELYEALIDLFAGGSLKISEILAAERLAPASDEEVVGALDAGVAMGMFEITAQPLPQPPASLPDQPNVVHPFNAHLLATGAFAGRPTALASPVSGSGYNISDFDVAILLELTLAGHAGLGERVMRRLASSGRSLQQNGEPITDEQLIAQVVEQACQNFCRDSLTLLFQLGILEAR
jgi:SAM-dependent methyltransferase